MAIKLFIVSLFTLSLSLVLAFVVSPEKHIKTQKKEVADVTFLDSIMYEINNQNVNKIVQSKTALHYKNKDEFYSATIYTRDGKKKNYSTNMISSDYLLKLNNQYIFKGNVIFDNNNEMTLNTDYLKYNTKTQLATNNHQFKLIYNDNTISGRNLYFNGISDIIKASHTVFNIAVEEVK